MRRYLLHFPIVIVTLAASLFLTPYDPTSGIRGLINRLSAPRVRPVHSVAMSDFYGTWGGSGVAVIRFQENYIVDAEKDVAYSYKIVRQVRNQNGEKACLIEVLGLQNGSNLRRYMYLAFNGDGLDYFGYTSWEQYEHGRASASTRLYRPSFE